MFVVPLYNGQQVLAVLQSQLADVDQPLLIEGAQNGAPVACHRRLLGLQGRIETSVAQIGHRHWWQHHCKHTMHCHPFMFRKDDHPVTETAGGWLSAAYNEPL